MKKRLSAITSFSRIARAAVLSGLLVSPSFAGEKAYLRLNWGDTVQWTAPSDEEPIGDLRIDTAAQVRARPGIPFNLRLKAIGAQDPTVWSLIDSSLPDGLELNAGTGAITGLPTAVGQADGLMVGAIDANEKTGRTRKFQIDVRPLPTVSIPGSEFVFESDGPKAVTPAATEVWGSQTWTLSGTLPFGLRFDQNNGSISGTPQQDGTFDNLTVSVRDGDGASGTSSAFRIIAKNTVAIQNYKQTYRARLGSDFISDQPVLVGMQGTAKYEIAQGSMPEGLTLSESTGVFSGIPAKVEKIEEIYIRGTDLRTNRSGVFGPISIDVVGDPTVEMDDIFVRLGNGVDVFPSTHGILGTQSWSVTPSLPEGLLSSEETGRVTGTPLELLSASGFTLTVIDNYDGHPGSSAKFAINVWPRLEVSVAQVNDAKVGEDYQISAPSVRGLKGAVTWSIAGSLPPGLEYNEATRRITGKPTQAGGPFIFSYVAKDSYDDAVASGQVTVNVAPIPLEGSADKLAFVDGADSYPALVGDFFGTPSPSIKNNVGGYTFPAATGLPSWLTLNKTTGKVSGYPPAENTYGPISIQVQDTVGSAWSRPFTIVAKERTIGDFAIEDFGPTFWVVEGVLLETGAPSVTGYKGPLEFSLAEGAKPDWLVLNRQTGELTGTAPTADGVQGLRLKVVDLGTSQSLTSNVFDISVRAAGDNSLLDIDNLPNPYSGRAFVVVNTGKPIVTGTEGHEVEFSTASGDLATGSKPWAALDLGDGNIWGTPENPDYIDDISIRVRDTITGETAVTLPFAIEIESGNPLSATAGSKDGVVGDHFTLTPQAGNANGGIREWTKVGSFPSWATEFNSATGEIGGYPDSVKVYPGLQLQAEDKSGRKALTLPFAISISAPPEFKVLPGPDYYEAEVGVIFDETPFVTQNARFDVTWELDTGTLPEGLSVTSDGHITGTPSKIETQRDITLKARDGGSEPVRSGKLTIKVVPPALHVLPGKNEYIVRSGKELATDRRATSGGTGGVRWKIVSGALPAGTELSSTTGEITGPVETPTIYPGIILMATDAAGETALSDAIAIKVAVEKPTISVPNPRNASTGHEITEMKPFVTGLIGDPTYTAISPMPPGLRVDAVTGAIVGKPTTVGTFGPLRIRLEDGFDRVTEDSNEFEIIVTDGMPIVDIPSIVYARETRLFTAVPETQQTTGARTWSLIPSVNWLAVVDPIGMLTGLPPGIGTHPDLRLKVVDSLNNTGLSNKFTVQVLPDLVVEDQSESVVGRIGDDLIVPAPTVSGVTGELSFSRQGDLPDGLKLDPSSGTISGTPRATGTWQIVLVAKDSIDGVTALSDSIEITIVGEPEIVVPETYTGRVGFDFDETPETSGLIGDQVWAEVELPAGLHIDTETGHITGTPEASGTFGPITLSVSDETEVSASSDPITFEIERRIEIEDAYVEGRTDKEFAMDAPVVSGELEHVTWSADPTTLPDWATVDTETGALIGTPTTADEWTVGLIATEDSGEQGFGDLEVVVTDKPIVVAADIITRIKADLEVEPDVIGAIGDKDFAQDGDLPEWALFSEESGAITGEPNALGRTEGITITVTDGDGAVGTSQPFAIEVLDGLEFADDYDAIKARVGLPMSSNAPDVLGLSEDSNWTLADGTLPNGLSVEAKTGKITGTPKTVGVFEPVVRATDVADGAWAESMPVEVEIIDVVKVVGVDKVLGGHVDEPMVGFTPNAENILGDVRWSVEGGLPDWASVDPATGIISGTPPDEIEVTGIRLIATDSADRATGKSAPFTLSVKPPLEIANLSTSYSARFGFPFNQAPPKVLNATGKPAWTLSGGTLPEWAHLNTESGVISGTADTSDPIRDLQLTVTDSTGSYATSFIFDIEVYSEPALTTDAGLYKVRIGNHVSIAPKGVGTVGAPIWSMPFGTLPAGLSFDRQNGMITGTPTEVADENITLRITDPYDGKFVETSFGIVVSDTLLAVGPQDDYTLRITKFLKTDGIIVTGSRGAITKKLIGQIPKGTAFDSSTGIISGAVAADAAIKDFRVTIEVTDDFDGAKVSIPITIKVTAPLIVGGAPRTNGRINTPISMPVPTVQNAMGDITWSPYTVPTGLTLDPLTGIVSGTLPGAGVRTVVISGKDVDGAADLSDGYVLDIRAPMVIGNASLTQAYRGAVFSSTFSTTNVFGPISWGVEGLPPGILLSVNNAGVGSFSGKSTAAGTFDVAVTITDSDGSVATKTIALNFIDKVPAGSQLFTQNGEFTALKYPLTVTLVAVHGGSSGGSSAAVPAGKVLRKTVVVNGPTKVTIGDGGPGGFGTSFNRSDCPVSDGTASLFGSETSATGVTNPSLAPLARISIARGANGMAGEYGGGAGQAGIFLNGLGTAGSSGYWSSGGIKYFGGSSGKGYGASGGGCPIRLITDLGRGTGARGVVYVEWVAQ